MWRVFSVGALALCLVSLPFRFAQADVISQYDFTDSSLASSDTFSKANSSDWTGPLPLGINVAAGNPAPSVEVEYSNVGNNVTTSMAGDGYYSFVVTPISGSKLTFDSLTFDFFKTTGANATVTATLFSSVNGFTLGNQVGTATLATGGESGSFFARNIDLSSLPADLVSPVTFRLYLDDGGASYQANYIGLDNIILNGTGFTPPVPEPSSITALAMLAVMLPGLRRRRRSNGDRSI